MLHFTFFLGLSMSTLFWLKVTNIVKKAKVNFHGTESHFAKSDYELLKTISGMKCGFLGPFCM